MRINNSFWTMRMATLLFCTFLSTGLWAQAGTSDSEKPGAPAASGSSAQSTEATASQPHDASFIIGNDDVLAISVWKEPDVSRSVPVRSDGKISLPLVGE